jgi:hypothetical protein
VNFGLVIYAPARSEALKGLCSSAYSFFQVVDQLSEGMPDDLDSDGPGREFEIVAT